MSRRWLGRAAAGSDTVLIRRPVGVEVEAGGEVDLLTVLGPSLTTY